MAPLSFENVLVEMQMDIFAFQARMGKQRGPEISRQKGMYRLS
jgi:hypothetical protein